MIVLVCFSCDHLLHPVHGKHTLCVRALRYQEMREADPDLSNSARWKYKIVSILLALMMIYLITGAIFCLVRGAGVGGAPFQVMVFGTIITYGVYFASSLLALDPWHLLIVSCLLFHLCGC
jgi:hypothetical protein